MSEQQNAVRRIIEQVIMKERYVTEDYLRRADEATDPEVREVFRNVVELRRKHFSELESHLAQLQSQARITEDINSMFW